MDKIIFDSRKNTFQPLRVFGILFCLIVLTAGLAGTACAEGWGSDYDSVSSLTIDSAANLTAFSQLVNSGKDFTGKTVNLANDIDLGDAEWTPIGNETHAFNGTFFGGNHKITGLNVTGDIRYAGLFGNVTGAVKNLNVDGNITVSREGDDTSFVGGIAGLNGGSIEYCTFKGDIKVSSNTGSVYAGGVVGSSSMTVTGCTFEGSITVKGNGIVYACWS